MTRIHAIRTGLVQVRRPQMESRGPRARRGSPICCSTRNGPTGCRSTPGPSSTTRGSSSSNGGNRAGPRTRISPALASVLPARRTLLRASRRGARPAAARPRHRRSRRPAGRAHASPHRPCGRAASRDRKPRVGRARRTRARQRSRRTRCRATCRTAGRNGGSRNSSASSARPFGPFDEAMPLTRRGDVADRPDAGPHTAPRVGGGPRRSVVPARGRHELQPALAPGRKGRRRQPRSACQRAARSRAFSRSRSERPLVYLPSHDPQSEARLAGRSVVVAASESGINTAVSTSL